MSANTEVLKTARLSSDGTHRFTLMRIWGDPLRLMVFVMLNPSTADAEVDDPTIRRCMGFARREGLDGISVVNLSSFRATNPADVPSWSLTIGNRDSIRTALWIAERANAPVVCAWGAGGALAPEAVHAVRITSAAIGPRLHCLGATKDGHPRHPLYVKADQPLEVWP